MRSWGYDLPEKVAEIMALQHRGNRENIAVLDAGAGDGLSGEALRRVGFASLTGIDLSPGMIEIAASRGVYKQAKVADLSKTLPFSADEFDMVTIVGVMTYLAPGQAFDEIIRVTKPGGS